MKGWQDILIGPDTSIRDALLTIDRAGSQLALVVDGARRLLGTLSDGDIRRGLIKGLQLSDRVSACMHEHPTTARPEDSRDVVISLMRRLALQQVPIVDADNVVVGVELVRDLLSPEVHENWVIIMAGGPGTRLKELTRSTPKPMLSVGGRPLLETIIQNYIDQGFRRFYLAVNYKAEIIEAHFGGGEALGADIRYIRETQPMGTAGALSLLPEMPHEPIFVSNGDLLVKVDYADMLSAHIRAEAAATMAVREYEVQIPFGVVSHDGGNIRRIEEKPIMRSLVSAGMYVLSPSVFELMRRETALDMPNLFDTLIASGKRTRCYVVDGYWLDIGRLPDYEKANHDFHDEFLEGRKGPSSSA
jgi:dTDP-glucose pyrophosphorylase